MGEELKIEDEELEGIFLTMILPEKWAEFYLEFSQWAGVNDRAAILVLIQLFNHYFQEIIQSLLRRIKSVSPVKYRYFVEKYDLHDIDYHSEFSFSQQMLQEYDEFCQLIKTEVVPKIKGRRRQSSEH